MNTKFRPRIQRAFVAWLAANKGRFLIPVSIGKRTDRFLTIQLRGVNQAVSTNLRSSGIVADVEWKGECLDLICCLEAYPEKSAEGGYHCMLSIEPRPRFVSREDLWINDVFEPFLEWVNEKLYPRPWLGLNMSSGSSFVQLLREQPRIETTKTDDWSSIYLAVISNQ